jgi:hypothetical protein
MYSFKFPMQMFARPEPVVGLRPDPVFIVGMHRSGTSALGGVIEPLGLSVGKTLMPPNADANPKGYYENLSIADLHDRFLSDVGRAWMDARPLLGKAFTGKAARRFRRELPPLILNEFGQERPLIKDPRLCTLLPLWMPLIAEAFPNTCFLLPVRHPVEVACSLRKRDQLPMSHGLALWMLHVLEAEKATRGFPRAFSTYDQLLESPAQTLDSLARKVNLPVGDHAAIVDSRIDSSLRHHSEQPWPENEPDADLILAVHVALTRDSSGMEDTLDKLRDAYYRKMEW